MVSRLKITDAQRRRLRNIYNGVSLYRSPFTSTDWALADRGYITLKQDTRRSAGSGFTTSYLREITDFGREVFVRDTESATR